MKQLKHYLIVYISILFFSSFLFSQDSEGFPDKKKIDIDGRSYSYYFTANLGKDFNAYFLENHQLVVCKKNTKLFLIHHPSITKFEDEKEINFKNLKVEFKKGTLTLEYDLNGFYYEGKKIKELSRRKDIIGKAELEYKFKKGKLYYALKLKALRSYAVGSTFTFNFSGFKRPKGMNYKTFKKEFKRTITKIKPMYGKTFNILVSDAEEEVKLKMDKSSKKYKESLAAIEFKDRLGASSLAIEKPSKGSNFGIRIRSGFTGHGPLTVRHYIDGKTNKSFEEFEIEGGSKEFKLRRGKTYTVSGRFKIK